MNPFQQQQQRMQRDRMMGGAWQQQQKAKEMEKELAKAQRFNAANKFNQVATEVEKLKKSLAAGKLTQTQFEERLASLMFQDEQGIWWMVGAETGGWYYYDGSSWLPGNPLGAQAVGKGKSKRASTGVKSASFMSRLSAKINAVLTFVFGVGFFGFLGFAAGEFVSSNIEDQYWPFIAAGVIWLGGFILISREARKLWRGG